MASDVIVKLQLHAAASGGGNQCRDFLKTLSQHNSLPSASSSCAVFESCICYTVGLTADSQCRQLLGCFLLHCCAAIIISVSLTDSRAEIQSVECKNYTSTSLKI